MEKKEFLLLLDEMLEAQPGKLKGSERLQDVEGWDSVAVLGFIALVDEHFDYTLAPRRLSECKTVDDLVALLDGRVK